MTKKLKKKRKNIYSLYMRNAKNMCYLVAKKFNGHGSLAVETQRGRISLL